MGLLKNWQIARITGLDAAYPLYMNTGSQGHLAASDATFVDVIHTDGGIFGFLRPLGHADFYPNGGKPLQPGCTLDNLISMGVTRLLNQYSELFLWLYEIDCNLRIFQKS